jgi:hypothetical protein
MPGSCHHESVSRAVHRRTPSPFRMGEGWGGGAMINTMITHRVNCLSHWSFNASPLPEPLPTEGRGQQYVSASFDKHCLMQKEITLDANRAHALGPGGPQTRLRP